MRLVLVKASKLTWRGLPAQTLLAGGFAFDLQALTPAVLRPILGGGVVEKPLWFGFCCDHGSLIGKGLWPVLPRARLVR